VLSLPLLYQLLDPLILCATLRHVAERVLAVVFAQLRVDLEDLGRSCDREDTEGSDAREEEQTSGERVGVEVGRGEAQDCRDGRAGDGPELRELAVDGA
jgi:hypothetical protein